jgi:hypothetical protein
LKGLSRYERNSIIPISDEQAKLAKVLVEAARALGGYAADLLGDLPKDVLGWLVSERVKAIRA